MSSELIMSLYASFAQAESESISRNITWGIERSFRNGNVRYRLDQTLGYRLSPEGICTPSAGSSDADEPAYNQNQHRRHCTTRGFSRIFRIIGRGMHQRNHRIGPETYR